ncbi:uncharacterized protein LOC122852387 [Aphidius gifuensis]|nr:uncharacterized protein LOC122852387 [Aphidius gifuensis]XP_044008089.1 uncharacterized protein LOC122852387 [Aphidius gifuensis]
MPSEVNITLPVVAGDVLALRGAGLAAPETWALLCQAAQALQDLFLSNGGVVGGGSHAGPVVTPHTIELTSRGRVMLQLAPPETARAYLPPEYRPGRLYSDTDSEKMWMYSLGRALLDTTPRAAALTGSVSVSPTSALQSVLAAMTEPDPRRRASLMNLLDVISEYCRTRLQSKPFTHIVMDMYREVMRSSQYAARRRIAGQLRSNYMVSSQQDSHVNDNRQSNYHYSKHQARGNLFKTQSRNSRSHPNLQSLTGQETTIPTTINNLKPQFQSQIDIKNTNNNVKINSQKICEEQSKSSHHLDLKNEQIQQTNSKIYSDPIYALPVKPFLSSQDVRLNRFTIKTSESNGDVYAQPTRIRNNCNSGVSQPNIAHLARNDEIIYDIQNRPNIHRQLSNPQLPNSNINSGIVGHYTNSITPGRLQVFISPEERKNRLLQNQESSLNVQNLNISVPPKPPRIITSSRQVSLLSENNEPPPKPPRNAVRNGPRARRGKPVQRAPSRLYRAISGTTRSLNKTQCIGPEFVVRANQPPKILSLCDVESGCTGRIVVILLTGQRIDVTCDPQKITAGELFQAIVQAENLDENFTLGLAALLAGDFAMLPPETKLNEVAPPGWLNNAKNKGPLSLPTSFMLYLRLRFFLPSVRGLRCWISKHLLYLQIRRCILEQQLVCPLSQLVNLTGLALQAEFGNYSVNEHGRGDYFLLEHYIPESLILNSDNQQSQLNDTDVLKGRLHQAHRDRRGLDTNTSEEMFIQHAQELNDYGSHFYIANVDTKELDKIIEILKKIERKKLNTSCNSGNKSFKNDNSYKIDDNDVDYSIYGKMEFSKQATYGNITNEQLNNDKIQQQQQQQQQQQNENDIYAIPKSNAVIVVERNNNKNSKSNINNNINNNINKDKNKIKKTDTNVWLAINSEGIKLFERPGKPRQRTELIRFEWKDIRKLSCGKNCLIVKLNGKRTKFKLRMDHNKNYYVHELALMHRQFFPKLKSEMTTLQSMTNDFGAKLTVDNDDEKTSLSSSPKLNKLDKKLSKISIIDILSKKEQKFSLPLEEYQNKENENPDKVSVQAGKSDEDEPVCYTPEDDALYAQVNARLEPEGASRDTEDEGERCRSDRGIDEKIINDDKLYTYLGSDINSEKSVPAYAVPKKKNNNLLLTDDERSEKQVQNPEDLYAAINKSFNKKNDFPAPDEIWDIKSKDIVAKNIHKIKTSSLPNYGTPKQSTGFRTPSLPRRLGVKMGTRAIYSSSVQRDSSLADDLESLSMKSDSASSIQSASAQSTESPLPEAYVLNADICTNDETFRITNDETMSDSLVARLEELSFAEERILHTVKLERGYGGSIGLQVTKGNDGGVYIQAISVGGSADMAGNVNNGDRIVAINGQSLLNFPYEDSLKMLQSTSATVELVLSQITSTRQDLLSSQQQQQQQHLSDTFDSNYLRNFHFEVSSEAEATNMTNKWLLQKAIDVASVQNTSSAYSSAASSAMGNHNTNNIYHMDVAESNPINSASMLLSLEDFDVSRTSRQVFI